MNRILLIPVVATLLAGSIGCQCCEGLMRFEAWKNNMLFGTGACGSEGCEHGCDPCQGGSAGYPAGCDSCQGAPIGSYSADGYPSGTVQPSTVYPNTPYTPPATSAPAVSPAPETYTPSL